jgi:hypothetical protein
MIDLGQYDAIRSVPRAEPKVPTFRQLLHEVMALSDEDWNKLIKGDAHVES